MFAGELYVIDILVNKLFKLKAPLAVAEVAPARLPPLRPRTAAMDAMVKKINASPRYAFEAAAAALDAAMAKRAAKV